MTLKNFMVKYSITARQLAGKLRVSMSAVRKWVQGTRIPRLQTIKRIHNLTNGEVTYDDWK